jgi:hypothetical protein
MDETEFTMNGQPHRLTRAAVLKAMRGQIPGRIQTYAVDVEGVRFPVKQVLAQSLRVPVTSFVSTRAQDILTKLGFEVINVEDQPDDLESLSDVDLRMVALEQSVSLHTGTTSDVDLVLATAARFEAWLAR